jgi:UDP-glucose 4-epimerase
MMLLDWPAVGSRQPVRQIALLFGLGLIGSAILSAVQARVRARRRDLPFHWSEPDGRAKHIGAILSAVRDLADAGADRGEAPRVDLIWSAGRAGFGSSPAEVASEQSVFLEVLRLADELGGIVDFASFHFLSSAGGLFEGQRNIDANSVPAPLRPYGLAKLQQEQYLAAALPRSARVLIYRPSSVYGFAGARSRRGLVTTLVQNAIRYQTTRIFGGFDTIRDYVFADDVGAFIADQVTSLLTSSRTVILASGKPTAIPELTAIVQRVVQRQLYYQYESNPSNALSFYVRPSALPAGWRDTPLEIGVYRTAARVADTYRAGAR